MCSVVMAIHRFKGCLLSKLNSFDQNFMKVGHIVKYHYIFFKFVNDLYHTMSLVINALCLCLFAV